MQEWRLDFECSLLQSVFTPVRVKESHDIRIGAETVRLEPTKDKVTAGHILFKLPSSVVKTWVAREEGKKRFEEIRAPLMLNSFFIEALEFKGIERINPPSGTTCKVKKDLHIVYSTYKEIIELGNDHINSIEKNHAIVQELKEQNTNVEFANNVSKWAFEGVTEREKFFNIWLTFNQIYGRYTDKRDRTAIESFAETFSKYKDAEECHEDHFRNISRLLKSTRVIIDGAVISPDSDPACVCWRKVFLMIYCVRKCLFHENRSKPEILKAASEILTDVVLISLREILEGRRSPAERRKDGCDCDYMSDSRDGIHS